MAANDEALFDDLFGDDDVGPSKTDAVKEKKDKKDKPNKKDKKEKDGKKEKKAKDGKKDKKDKDNKDESLVAEAAADAETQSQQVVLPILKQDKTDKKDKDKKAKKDEKKNKKDKKDTPPAVESSSVAPPEVAAAPSEGLPAPDKEKEKKAKKDGKEKKAKKEGKEKKDKKEKGEKRKEPEGATGETAEPVVPSDPVPTDAVDQVLDLNDMFADNFGAEDVPATHASAEQAEDDALQDFFGDLQAEIADEADEAKESEKVESEKGEEERAESRDGGDGSLIPVIIPPNLGPNLGLKKKRRLTVTSKENRDDEDEEQGPSLSQKWTEVMESLKFKKPFAINEGQESTKFIQNFIEDMVTAAESDMQEFYAGRLGKMTHKVNMLGKAVSVMQKVVFGELFVTFGGCRALAFWLKPMPNGQLPNVHLRTTVLTCMLRLPISKDALQNCKDPALGEIVKNLMQNPRETVPNRKTAAMLVQKWIKQVLVNNESSGDAQQDEEENLPTLPPKPIETAESFQQLEEESFKRIHPTIPIREGKDYKLHPDITAMALRRDKYAQESNRYKVNEVLKVFNRPNKKSWKPYAVSIAGRQLNQL